MKSCKNSMIVQWIGKTIKHIGIGKLSDIVLCYFTFIKHDLHSFEVGKKEL